MNDMKIKRMQRKNTQQDGLTLLVTLLLMGILLAVSTSLLNVTMKQYQLSGISYASEVAFQAANAGMECVLYHDYLDDAFDVPNSNPVQNLSCMGVVSDDLIDGNGGVGDSDEVSSTEEQRFQFEWSNGLADEEGVVCTNVSIYKFYDPINQVPVVIDTVDYRNGDDCPEGGECTVVQSRGYNVPCDELDGSRVVEREYTLVY